MKKAEKYAKAIRDCQSRIDEQNTIISKLAKEAIPDFHFLNYKVSTFWDCDKSPIGVCLFCFDAVSGRYSICRYCFGPVERK